MMQDVRLKKLDPLPKLRKKEGDEQMRRPFSYRKASPPGNAWNNRYLTYDLNYQAKKMN